MSIIESIRIYICGCPFLKDGAINVDYLGDKPIEYTIDVVPSSTIIKQYTDGGCLKQYTFIFASREYYGDNTGKNIDNSSFYEDFASWLNQQSDNGTLPELGDGKQSQKIEALSTGYLSDGAPGNARYQIECRLIYFEN